MFVYLVYYIVTVFLFFSAGPNEEEKNDFQRKNDPGVRSILYLVELVQKEERFAVPNRVDFKMKLLLLLMVNYLALSVGFTKICEINFT